MVVSLDRDDRILGSGTDDRGVRSAGDRNVAIGRARDFLVDARAVRRRRGPLVPLRIPSNVGAGNGRKRTHGPGGASDRQPEGMAGLPVGGLAPPSY